MSTILPSVCPALTIANSSLIKYEEAEIGNVTTVSCADFFELQGESVFTCNAVSSTAAEWSSDAPTCTKGNL